MDKSLDEIIKEKRHHPAAKKHPQPVVNGAAARAGPAHPRNNPGFNNRNAHNNNNNNFNGRLGSVAGGKVGKNKPQQRLPYSRPPPRALESQWKHDLFDGPRQPPRALPHTDGDLRNRLNNRRPSNDRLVITTFNEYATPIEPEPRFAVGGLVSDRMAVNGRLGPGPMMASPFPQPVVRSRLVNQTLAAAGATAPVHGHAANGYSRNGRPALVAAAPAPKPVPARPAAPEPAVIEIANLHPEASTADLKETFLEFGDILDVELRLDSQGLSTGVARIKFTSRPAAAAAIERFDGKMADGQILKVVEIPQGVSILGKARTIYTNPAPLQSTHTSATSSPAPAPAPALRAAAVGGSMYSDRIEATGRLGPRPEAMEVDGEYDGGRDGRVFDRVGGRNGSTTFSVRW
ncbi:hypothetical protein HK097_002947 [Rhizophlyctis rosea]|uniref:RRM domain-containing protein n=1 Tax=Rhizophlyctis rosea TaxID=64517 RepID=A0AAD5SGM6_9FUNG|nr:hypothetical protein HK097_002947 [Rhizophlyctis rosea]